MKLFPLHGGNAPVSRVRLPKGRRILCISDIHGNLPWFEGLLDKAGYTPDDVLVLVGDMVEKGRHSLALLRRILELGKQGPVYAVRGNCDGWDIPVDNQEDEELDEGARFYLNFGPPWRDEALLAQMCREIGVEILPTMDMKETKARLREAFRPELDFLRSLPTILDTEHYTFVHAGLPEPGAMEEQSAARCEKVDAFMRLGLRFDKWVVVGHWPVMDYSPDKCVSNPLVDRELHIASIDGGCVVKDYGQLNALIIPHDGSEEFSFVSYDDFPRRRVTAAQKESERSVFIHYGDNEVDVITPGEKVSLCRHIRTGCEFYAPTNYLHTSGDRWICRDFTNYLLALTPGDTVSLVEETPLGAVVKKDGVMGLYQGVLQ